MIYKTRGIILRSNFFSETSKNISLLSENFGKIQLLAKGALRPKSPFAGQLEIFCYGNFIYQKNQKNDTNTLLECDIISFFRNLREDYNKFFYTNYIIETIAAIVQFTEESKKIFRLVLNILQNLNISPKEEMDTLLRFFEVKLLYFLGFLPSFNYCDNCNAPFTGNFWLDLNSAQLICNHCHIITLSSLAISIDIAKIIAIINDKDLKILLSLKLSLKQKKQLENILRILLDFHLEKKLESQVFLRK